MGEIEHRVPTAGGQVLDFCLKAIGEQQQLDANTMLALLSLVNLTNILELIGQGRSEANVQVPKQTSGDSLPNALSQLIPPGSDKMGMLNSLMGMMGGGGGDISKLMPLISMLGSAMKSNQAPLEEPVQKEEPVQSQGETAATEAETQEPRSGSGWARVGK